MIEVPKLSVLMPVYNGAQYLRPAVDSILAQTFRDFEFIVIDDGSSDQTLEILKSYQDARLKIYQNEKNLGIVTTLNKGLGLARADLIVRMDADDLSVPTRLQKQFDFMNLNPEVGIAGGWLFVIGEFPPGEWRPATDPNQIRTKLFFGNSLAHNTIIYRKSFLDRYSLRYEQSFPHAEDWRLWWKASNYFSLANIPEILVLYRWHEANVSTASSLTQYETGRRIVADIRSQFHLPHDASTTSAFHFYFEKKLQTSLSFLEEAEAGFTNLLNWNDRHQKFDPLSFRNQVSESFSRFALTACVDGLSTFKFFWRSPLSQKTRYSLQGLRLFLSCVARRRLTMRSFLIPFLPLHLPLLVKHYILNSQIKTAIKKYYS